jgi:hypothetical protein
LLSDLQEFYARKKNDADPVGVVDAGQQMLSIVAGIEGEF